MLNYYRSQNNLGGQITNQNIYDLSVEVLGGQDDQFQILSGYSLLGGDGDLVIVDNNMTFMDGDTVLADDIKEYRLYNSDYTASILVNFTYQTLSTKTLTITMQSIINDLFEPVTTQQAIDGETVYRCIYIKNDGEDITGGKLWIETDVSEGSIEIGLGSTNSVAKTSNGFTAPDGIVFDNPIDEASGVNLGTLNNTWYIPLWIKRTNPPSTTPDDYNFTIGISHD